MKTETRAEHPTNARAGTRAAIVAEVQVVMSVEVKDSETVEPV
jgi:hypothetical protein